MTNQLLDVTADEALSGEVNSLPTMKIRVRSIDGHCG